jgi:general secretion pathway protein G
VQLRIENRNRSRRHAFTLMEVLVVVAILVVLAGIGVAVFRYLDTGKEGAAKMQVKNIETAVMSYNLDHKQFPESLNVLTQPSEGKAAYLKQKDLVDPWNRPFEYHPDQLSSTGEPLIMSQGANPGQSKVIRNWD